MPRVLSVFIAVLLLWVNAVRLEWLDVSSGTILALAILLVCVHEILRPFCLSLSETCRLAVHVSGAATVAVFCYVKRGLRPLFPEWTVWYEWFQAISFSAGQRGGEHIIKLPNAPIFRRNFEFIGNLLGRVACLRYGNVLESFEYIGLEHLWVRPQSSASAKKTSGKATRRVTVLYYHGGGYTLFCPRFFVEFANRLLDQIHSELLQCGAKVDIRILLANYRKLPECCFPTPLDDAMSMYNYLVQHEAVAPHDIILAGDSAGGALALATLLRLRDARHELPLAAMCSCPFGDISSTVGVSEHCFVAKPMLDAIRNFCIGAESQDAGESWREAMLLQANLRGLPPLFVQGGQFDILHQQSLQLAKKASADGVSVELDVHAHMPHVFVLFPYFMMPRSSVGIQRLATFVAAQVAASRTPAQLSRPAPSF